MKSLMNFNDDFGTVKLNIGKLMQTKDISVSKMVKLTGLHHKVVLRYYNNEVERYDTEVLAKLCYVLECKIEEIMEYHPPL